MEDIIRLDKETLKALVVDTRVNILKLLNLRNYTLTEISKELGIAHTTAKEHLIILENAGLVKRLNEGRKWKYYKLTYKGKNFIEPQEVKIWITLAASGITFIGGAFYLISKLAYKAPQIMMQRSMAAEITMPAIDAQSSIASQIQITPWIVLIISALISGICAGYLLNKKYFIIKAGK